MMPIPLAITIILSKLVAELKGDRNGPYTHPGRELGVLRMACNSLVQLPAVAMHTDVIWYLFRHHKCQLRPRRRVVAFGQHHARKANEQNTRVPLGASQERRRATEIS